MFTKKRLAIAVAVAGTIAAGCDKAKELKKTESGYKYYHIVENGGDKPVDNDVVKFHYTIYNAADSIIHESDRSLDNPPAMPLSAQDSGFILAEGFRLASEGDSLLFEAKAQEIFGDRLPPFAKMDEPLKMGVKILSVQTMEEAQQERMEQMKKAQEEREAKLEEQKPIDDELITKYLADNNIKAEKTESGLYYVITKKGSGVNPEAGQTVKVHYTGTLLDGTKFDSSVDRGEPFEFPLGQGRVIKGWDEGIALLNKGAKATLYLPSHLAYGERGAGAIIKPFSVLKFDVELVDIVAQ